MRGALPELSRKSNFLAGKGDRPQYREAKEWYLLVWKMLKETILSFIEDEALTRGAAIAFYTVTSIAPVLLIVIAIAGIVFGRDAAQNALIPSSADLWGDRPQRCCNLQLPALRANLQVSLQR